MERKIYYREGYKYQLVKDYTIKTNITGYQVNSKFIQLFPTGVLIIKDGYSWDGPSGPTLDTKNSMRGSLVHDAFYQLLREGKFTAHIKDVEAKHKEHERIRQIADDALSDICKEDGMTSVRAELWEFAVENFAYNSSTAKGGREVLTAGVDA